MLGGMLETGWTRRYVLSYWRDGNERLAVFEPAPGGSVDWKLRSFHVRGAARIVERENNPRRARERFDTLTLPK